MVYGLSCCARGDALMAHAISSWVQRMCWNCLEQITLLPAHADAKYLLVYAVALCLCIRSTVNLLSVWAGSVCAFSIAGARQWVQHSSSYASLRQRGTRPDSAAVPAGVPYGFRT